MDSPWVPLDEPVAVSEALLTLAAHCVVRGEGPATWVPLDPGPGGCGGRQWAGSLPSLRLHWGSFIFTEVRTAPDFDGVCCDFAFLSSNCAKSSLVFFLFFSFLSLFLSLLIIFG